MGLEEFVTDEPPQPRSVWRVRFQEISDAGLIGEWINASAAWGIGWSPVQVRKAADKDGWDIDARSQRGVLWICVKGKRKGKR